MEIHDYNMPAKLTFRKEITNEDETFFSVSIEAVDNDGTIIKLDVTQCEDAKKYMSLFDEGLKRRGY